MAWITKNSQEEYQEKKTTREYTKKEKAVNWWIYHKWMVLGIALGILLVAMIIKDTVFQVQPDYQVAWVGKTELPTETYDGLTASLEAMGEDINGDGKVVVQLNQYTVIFNAAEEEASVDANMQMAGMTKMSADLSGKSGSYIFIVQDPEGFETQTGILQYRDGTLPVLTGDQTAPADWQNCYYRWTDCPVLTGLDLGVVSGATLESGEPYTGQDVLENVYIGRRGIWKEEQAENYTGCAALWDALTAGATA